jgi:hypothetical protein
MSASDSDSAEGATSLEPIALPEPKLRGGASLADAFHQRRTKREFSD